WFDVVAALQLAWVGLSLWLVLGTRLFAILGTVAAGSMLLTLVQLATGSDTLALLFPWRTSAGLGPLATAIIPSTGGLALAPRLDGLVPRTGAAVRAACVLVVALLAAGGAAIMALGWGYKVNEDERELLDYVRAAKGRDYVYLLPVALPKLGSGPRGVT